MKAQYVTHFSAKVSQNLRLTSPSALADTPASMSSASSRAIMVPAMAIVTQSWRLSP